LKQGCRIYSESLEYSEIIQCHKYQERQFSKVKEDYGALTA
jgi:hypothetical protein